MNIRTKQDPELMKQTLYNKAADASNNKFNKWQKIAKESNHCYPAAVTHPANGET